MMLGASFPFASPRAKENASTLKISPIVKNFSQLLQLFCSNNFPKHNICHKTNYHSMTNFIYNLQSPWFISYHFTMLVFFVAKEIALLSLVSFNQSETQYLIKTRFFTTQVISFTNWDFLVFFITEIRLSYKVTQKLRHFWL